MKNYENLNGDSLQNRVRDYLIELQPAVVVEVNGIDFLSMVEREAQLIAKVQASLPEQRNSHVYKTGERENTDFIDQRFPNAVKVTNPSKAIETESRVHPPTKSTNLVQKSSEKVSSAKIRRLARHSISVIYSTKTT